VLGLKISYLFFLLFAETTFFDDVIHKLISSTLVLIWAAIYLNSWENKEKLITYKYDLKLNSNKYNSQKGRFNMTSLDFNYLGVMIKDNKYSKIDNLKKLLSYSITLILIVLIVFLTILVYSIFNNNENASLNYLQENIFGYEYWNYISALLILLTRLGLSKLNEIILEFSTNLENHSNFDEYHNSILIKTFMFEFVNFNFNIYYITFIKQYYGYCSYYNCINEAQLNILSFLLLIILIDLGKLLVEFIFRWHRKRNLKNCDPKVNSFFDNNEVNSNEAIFGDNNGKNYNFESKYEFYVRSTLDRKDTDKRIVLLIMTFGYLLQFGSSMPIIFIFVLIHVFCSRIIDAFQIVKCWTLSYISNYKLI